MSATAAVSVPPREAGHPPLAVIVAAAAAVGLGIAALVPDARSALALLPLVATVVIDVRTRRIPNWLTLGGIAFALASAGGGEFVSSLLGMIAAAGIGLVLVFAARGAFGMGDVKLMGYAGAVVGLAHVPLLLFAMSLTGGVLALVIAARRGVRGQTLAYGPAIAVGCALVLLFG